MILIRVFATPNPCIMFALPCKRSGLNVPTLLLIYLAIIITAAVKHAAKREKNDLRNTMYVTLTCMQAGSSVRLTSMQASSSVWLTYMQAGSSVTYIYAGAAVLCDLLRCRRAWWTQYKMNNGVNYYPLILTMIAFSVSNDICCMLMLTGIYKETQRLRISMRLMSLWI